MAGDGSPSRRVSVLKMIDAIVDPCSRALGKPVGLVGMGIIERVDIEEGHVSVVVLPTFPTCLFRGVFEEEIETRLLAIPWCEAVSVSFASAASVWDESRLTDAARRTLGRHRDAGAGVHVRKSPAK